MKMEFGRKSSSRLVAEGNLNPATHGKSVLAHFCGGQGRDPDLGLPK